MEVWHIAARRIQKDLICLAPQPRGFLFALIGTRFDYQSECHCSKTSLLRSSWLPGLITSQNATAPKLLSSNQYAHPGLITSQNATAPKLLSDVGINLESLITSQNATAPKPSDSPVRPQLSLITSQNATAPKRASALP